MQRRQFLKFLSTLGIAPTSALGFSGLPLEFDLGQTPGDVTLMHFTDCHAQLLPLYFREPEINLGTGQRIGKPPHLVGLDFLEFFAVKPDTRAAYAMTHLNFTEAAERYGKMGGLAHLATLIKQIRSQRGPSNSLLLDGGDSWQGSATALWSQGRDMLGACNLLEVDAMTGHWEFTYGERQVMANIADFNGDFVAHNADMFSRWANERNLVVL